MTRYAIVTDLDRCVGCLACSVACKMVNGVPVGSFWNKVLRIGPNPKAEGATFPNVDLYFLPVGCQHCEKPECVAVCPTGASHKLEDGTVQIDKSKCIGCQFCAMACPYGVRYLNEEERVVEKCTLCEQRIAQGELPQCVSNCVRACALVRRRRGRRTCAISGARDCERDARRVCGGVLRRAGAPPARRGQQAVVRVHPARHEVAGRGVTWSCNGL